MKRLRIRTLFVSLLLGAVAGAALYTAPDRTAHAVCEGDGTQGIDTLFSVSPAPDNLTLQGPAPFKVTITFEDRTILSTADLAMSFTWGDGASTPVTIVPCGDDKFSWPAQVFSHTYSTPGQYAVQWHLSASVIGQVDSLAVIVTVTAAEPTAAPATPTPLPPTQGAATPTTAAAATPTPAPDSTVTPGPSATAAASASPTATVSATPPTATTTPTQPAAAPAVVTTPPPPSPPTTDPDRPELIRAVPGVEDVSTDPGVVVTNVVLAGVTIWVFFSSVLFNQTMSAHREEVSGWLRWVPKPKTLRPSAGLRLRRVPATILVLGGLGLIYGFLDSGFGFNQRSLSLFLSIVIGVGVVGYFFSALEAWSRKRTLGALAEVRPFPMALVVAVASVLISRLLGLHPGVVYGFAASCVVIGGSVPSKNEGRALVVPITACLGLSVVCWLLTSPVRALPGNFFSHLLEGIAIIVFVGGLEGLLLNLVPLDVMDGAKIYRWNRLVWAALLLVSAFLFWHVLLNSQKAYFDSLRVASSLSVVVAFALYTLAGIGLWGYFRWQGRKQSPPLAAPEPATESPLPPAAP